MAIQRRKRKLIRPKSKVDTNVQLLESQNKEEVKQEEEVSKVNNPNQSELKEAQEILTRLALVKQEKKQLEATEKELVDKLKVFTNKYGVVNDKGSYNFKLGKTILTNTARVVSKLNQDKAIESFNKLGVLSSVSEIKTVVNEDLIEQEILNGRIPKEILNDIMDTKTNFVFTFKDSED